MEEWEKGDVQGNRDLKVCESICDEKIGDKLRLNGFRFLNRMLVFCFGFTVYICERWKGIKYSLSLTFQCLTFKPSLYLVLTKKEMKTKCHAHHNLIPVFG